MRCLRGTLVLSLLALVAIGVLAACSVSDTDVAGTWNGNRFNDNGSTDFTLVLAQNGSNLSGSYTDGGWSGVIAGQIDGDSLTLTLTLTTVPAGSPMEIWTFTGTVNDNAMSGTLQAGANEMNWTATLQ